MGEEFIKMITYLLGWFLIIIAFAFYVLFQDYLVDVPNYIVIIGTMLIVTLGIGMITWRSYRKWQKAKDEGTGGEKMVIITPFDQFKHDLLALLTFGIVIVWVSFMGESITGLDVAQAVIAFLGVMLVRFIYRRSAY